MVRLSTECPGLESILRDAQEVAGYLWERGWAERNAGNLSIDVTALVTPVADGFSWIAPQQLPSAVPALGGRIFLVTGTGRRFRDFARDVENNSVLLRLDDDGAGHRRLERESEGPALGPTSELPSHLELHRYLLADGSGLSVVLHTHPTELIALTHMPDCRDGAGLNRALWSVHPEVKVFLPRGVGLVPYTLPGTRELGAATVEVMREGHEVAVWQFHGCLAVGTGASEAFDLIDTVDKAARISLLCRHAGHRPDGLGPEEQAELAELARSFRGR
jgi:rhamnulose-1-phosphate aldolase